MDNELLFLIMIQLGIVFYIILKEYQKYQFNNLIKNFFIDYVKSFSILLPCFFVINKEKENFQQTLDNTISKINLILANINHLSENINNSESNNSNNTEADFNNISMAR